MQGGLAHDCAVGNRDQRHRLATLDLAHPGSDLPATGRVTAQEQQIRGGQREEEGMQRIGVGRSHAPQQHRLATDFDLARQS